MFSPPQGAGEGASLVDTLAQIKAGNFAVNSGGSDSGRLRVLLIERTTTSSIPMYTSRVILNLNEVKDHLIAKLGDQIDLLVVDLAKLSFEQQIQLVASVGMIIGVHGAGVPTSMHMSLGSPGCCGVIEIFPEGEFKPIRGYGNMARRVGHYYERMDLSFGESATHGATVPPDKLTDLTSQIITKIRDRSSCVLASVVEDPFFEKTVPMRSDLSANNIVPH
jgi:hypothetical protein